MTTGGIGRVETQRAVLFGPDDPLQLESGARLAPVEVAYETYGTLAPARDNVVFVCHALTGDAHAAGHHGDPSVRGWWDNLIGPGRPVDTDRWFVVSPNLLGGCGGTTGPSSADPQTGRPHALEFPLLTVRDLVAVHRRLLAGLGIERLHAAVGGSLGGMQTVQWALDHPTEIGRVAAIGATGRLSAQNIAFSAVAREAILAELRAGRDPADGMALARRIGHITYLSELSMERKFGRDRRDPAASMSFADDFEVEHYLTHQGSSFLDRFEPFSYLYLSRMMDYFDPFGDRRPLPVALTTRFLVLSFSTDWRFGPPHSDGLAAELSRLGAPVDRVDIESPWGHDSFLLDLPDYHAAVAQFLSEDGVAAPEPDPRDPEGRLATPKA
jgi:homoserine O-acetyltransferase